MSDESGGPVRRRVHNALGAVGADKWDHERVASERCVAAGGQLTGCEAFVGTEGVEIVGSKVVAGVNLH